MDLETDLIQRLASELFGGTTAGTPFPPEAVPSPSRDISLHGGFPATSPSSPVHPTVVAAEPDLSTRRAPTSMGTGTHDAGAVDSYEFGEPRFCSRTFGQLGADPAGAGGFPGKGIGEVSPLSSLQVEGIRRDFPALHQRVNGHPLIWLDNAATTQKPQAVLDATSRFYGRDNSNIHRAAHVLAERSTKHFEAGRERVRQFLGAGDAKEIVFLRGTTEAINLVAQSFGRSKVGPGDEILLTEMEHHANIVPWQLLAQQTGAVIRVAPINHAGELNLDEFGKLLSERTKIVSVTHVSNALGTINPIEQIVPLARSVGAAVVVDGAQSTPHLPVNVQALDVDFYAFSGHKVFGPTGIGALYGKAAHLEAMPPWQGGGHMIRDVSFERTVYQNAPEKFEAGTPDIAGVVGLAAAIEYLFQIGIPAIGAYEHALLEYATRALETVPGLRPIGTAAHKASVLSFVIPGVETTEIARHLDRRGIAVRAGHHCALPAQRHFGLEATVRPSLAFYNTFAEVDALVEALYQLPIHR